MNLKLYYEGVGAPATDSAKAMIEPWVREHIEPMLSRAGAAYGQLVATVSHHAESGAEFKVKLRMHLPRRHIVVASAEAAELEAALRQAEDRFLEQVGDLMNRLRQQVVSKRKVRRQRLRELESRVAGLPGTTSKQATSAIEPLLPRLERVVRRELAYLRNSGDLTGDYPTVQDAIDEAVAAVKVAWRTGETEDTLSQNLLREAFRAIDREIEASWRYGEMLSLDESPGLDADDQAEAMVEEEIFEYYQPDEVLRLSDVLPDETAVLPDAGLEAAQQAFSLETLGDLPMLWRRALMLSEFERLAAADITEILEAESVMIEKWLEQARAFLHDHLRQAGFPDEGGWPWSSEMAERQTGLRNVESTEEEGVS